MVSTSPSAFSRAANETKTPAIQYQPSLKVQPAEVSVLNATGRVGMPTEANCLNQLAHVHRLRDSELNYNEHQYNRNMQMLRNHEGLGVPLKMGMERFAARQVGRLPFLSSR